MTDSAPFGNVREIIRHDSHSYEVGGHLLILHISLKTKATLDVGIKPRTKVAKQHFLITFYSEKFLPDGKRSVPE